MKRTNACLLVGIFLLQAFCLVVESIDTSDIPVDDRRAWCQQQVASCPLICADQGDKNTAEQNVCYVKTLDFKCVCNNGFSPDDDEYTQTIPYFKCTKEVEDCKNACKDDSTCIDGCNKECGVKDPPKRKKDDEPDEAGTDKGDVIDDEESASETSDEESDGSDVFAGSATVLPSFNGCFTILLAVALAVSANI